MILAWAPINGNTAQALLHFIRRRQRAVYFFGTICFCFWFSYQLMWPGGFSTDSALQEQQSQTRIFTNDHPPIMAWFWGIVSHYIVHSRCSLLAFHLILFWASIFMLGLINIRIALAWAYLGIGIWLIPPILAMSNVIWKDTGMTMACALGCMIIAYHQRFGNKLHTGIVLLVVTLFFYATAVRHNAIVAMPPLVYWLVQVTRETATTTHRKLLLTAMICIALFTGKIFFESAVTVHYKNPAQEIMLIDLSSMSQRLNKPLLPSYVYTDSGLNFEQFKKKEYMGWNGKFLSNRYGTSDPQKLLELRQAYINMITNYPLQFLSYRWYMFMGVLGFYGAFWPTNWGTSSKSILAVFAQDYLKYTAQGLWFKAYLWLFATIALLLAACRKGILPEEVREAILYLNLSAILYILPNYLLVASGDFRYNYWTIAAVTFSVALLLPVLRRRQLQRRANI